MELRRYLRDTTARYRSIELQLPKLGAWHGLLFLSFLLIALAQLHALSEPMGLDEGVYFAVARSHALPYVEVFDQKPPIVYLWYKLALLLNGGEANPAIARLLATSMLAATAAVVFGIGKHLEDQRLGAIAALIFALYTANQYVIRDANTESFALLPLTRSLYFSLKQRSFWAGVSAGMAIATKSTLLLPALALALAMPRREVKRLLTGICLIGLLVVLPWLVAGSFPEFWQANVSFNLKYRNAVPLGSRPELAALGTLAAALGSLPLVAISLWGVQFVSRRLVVWTIGCGFAVAATGIFLPYYFSVLMPSFSLLGAAGCLATVKRWRNKRVRLVVEAALPALAAFSLVSLLPIYLASDSEAAHRLKVPILGDDDIVAQRLAPQLPPGGRLFVIGRGSPLYSLTDSQPATRIVLSGMLSLDSPLASETLSRVQRSPPDFIAEIYEGDDVEGSFPEIRELVSSQYEVWGTARSENTAGILWRFHADSRQ